VTLTPRRRVLLAVVLAAVVVVAAVVAADLLGVSWWCRTAPAVACTSGGPCSVEAEPGAGWCSPVLGVPVVHLVLLALGASVIVLLGWAAGVWALQPVRAAAQVVGSVGPHNLGLRIRARGPADELRQLSDAVDAMMDRVAAGYDAQRRFAANASHELRTPLAVQRTLIEVSLDAADSPDRLEMVAGQLLRANERNERLIEGLLVLSETDQGLLTRAPHRLDEIVREVLAGHEPAARAGGLRLESALGERVVDGERVLLERLVTNLVQNAIKYNRPGGCIAVRVGDRPALAVENTGEPVPAEEVGSLFEPFRRLTGQRIHHQGGAGLGLTIVRSIVQAHGGRLAARPGVDGGLSVEVDLPRPA
jgi:signal transduction histidine kinase